MAGVLQAPAAAHDVVQARHDEGDVVQAIVVGIGQRNVVVVGIAAHERHDAGAVREPETERVFVERLACGDVTAVEHHMGEALGVVLLRCGVGMAQVFAHRAQDAALRVLEGHAVAAARLIERGRCAQQRAALRGHRLRERLDFAARGRVERYGQQFGRGRLCQRQQMVQSAAAAQIHRSRGTRGDAQVPGAGVEALGGRDIGHADFDAAQCIDKWVGHDDVQLSLGSQSAEGGSIPPRREERWPDKTRCCQTQ